jgi:hypothetical protein
MRLTRFLPGSKARWLPEQAIPLPFDDEDEPPCKRASRTELVETHGGLMESHTLKLAELESQYLLAKKTLQDRFEEDTDTVGLKTSTFAAVNDERTWASAYLNESDWLQNSREMYGHQLYQNESLRTNFVADVDMAYDILKMMRASGFLTRLEYESFALAKPIMVALAKWITQVRTQERRSEIADDVAYSDWDNGEGRALAQAVFYAEVGDRAHPEEGREAQLDYAYNIWSTEEGWVAKNKAISNEEKGRKFMATFAATLAKKLRTENERAVFPAWFWNSDLAEVNEEGIHTEFKKRKWAR